MTFPHVTLYTSQTLHPKPRILNPIITHTLNPERVANPYELTPQSYSWRFFLRILVCLVIFDSGKMSLEHLLLSWYSSQPVEPTESITPENRLEYR